MSEPYIGEIRLFAFSRVPNGWVACDGASLSPSTYAPLYSLIGNVYGGDGVSFFKVPDLRGRVPISQGTGPGLSPRTLGESGGEASHTLIERELASHGHALTSTVNPGTTATPGPSAHLATANPATNKLYAPQANVTTYDLMAPAVTPTGGGKPHDNMMPTLTCNYCICTEGVYPSPN